MRDITLGKTALLLTLLKEDDDAPVLRELLKDNKYRKVAGNVGAMSINKIMATIHTAAVREHVIPDTLVSNHALYHALYECVLGLLRGQAVLGELFRTAGIRYAVVAGSLQPGQGEWVAAAMYGTIGAPIKGMEHEAFGFGISHISREEGRARGANRNIPW